MKNAHFYVRWFLIGMGNFLGFAPGITTLATESTEMEAIGGDFHAVGNDLRIVMRNYPATPETARQLGQAVQQLELSGIK